MKNKLMFRKGNTFVELLSSPIKDGGEYWIKVQWWERKGNVLIKKKCTYDYPGNILCEDIQDFTPVETKGYVLQYS